MKPVALITGASRGIGRSTAIRLSRDHDIIAVARSKPDLDSLASELGSTCRTIVLDLEREAFLALLGTQKTRDRIQHMLKEGKPLRN